MKLFEAFLLINSFVAQKNGRRTAEEAGSPLPADYNDERYYATNNKPNKKPSNNNQNYETYGDPHFMVQSLGSDPICFDYNPPSGAQITLLSDPENGMIVTGRIGEMNEHNKTYIDHLYLMSPEGAHLNFNTSGVLLHGLPVSKHFETHQTGGPKRMKYSDITFIEKWNEDGTHDRIIIDIENGPKFLISAKVRKGSMSFGIMDINGLSPKCKGILGNFIRPGSYHVLPRVELDEETGAEQAIIINDYMAVNSVKKDFHKNDLCWTVDEKDVDELLSNV